MLTTRVADDVSDITPSPEGGTTMGTRQCISRVSSSNTPSTLFPFVGGFVGAEWWWDSKVPYHP